MSRRMLYAAAAAALALMLAGCANKGPYSDDGSLAYDYGYSPFEGVYGGDWGPEYYDGGGYHRDWHAGEDWHGQHFAPHEFGGVPHGGIRLGFADMHGGGFGGFHGGGFHGGGFHGGGFGGHGGGGRA